jgi:CRISPR-associated protein (TIGR03986 family)
MPPPNSIDSPYNFVPLADWVHCPSWAKSVSHDLPFRDGICGHLDLTITAHTPLLVGDQQQNTNNTPGEVKPFKLPNGTYAIPGTSLKGMIRAIIEIASFSRMNLVDDQRLGVRDLTGGVQSYQKAMTTTEDGAFKSLSKAGWLSFDRSQGRWLIQPCLYARIERLELTDHHQTPWVNISNQSRPTAKEKYDAWMKSLQISFDVGEEKKHPHSPDKHGKPKFLVYRKASNLGRGKTEGTLVFTGQPSPKKHLEFIFYGTAGQPITVPEEVFRGFLDIHDQKTENSDPTAWTDWRDKPRVPIFYLEEPNKRGTVASLGLALMYKLAYHHSIHDAIRHSSPEHFNDDAEDLATLMFGRVGDKPEKCLKGRVTFQHATADGKPAEQPQPATILNGPKPTYYPNYIQQPTAINCKIPEKMSYTTLMDDTCQIRGWKRYPARSSAQVQQLTPEQVEKTAVQVKLHTLPASTTFQTQVNFHNLKPAELGALCWALTWAGDEHLRHSLGMGKPFGFGQVSIAINPQKSFLRPNAPDTKQVLTWESCRQAFVEYMEKNAQARKKKWKNSPQIAALLGMADPNKHPLQGTLNHMRLSTENDNQFKDAKKERLVLSEYAKGTHPSGLSLTSENNAGAANEWMGVEIKLNPGSGELSITHQGKVATALNPTAQELRDHLPNDLKERLKKNKALKGCRVQIKAVGNRWNLVAILAVGEVTIPPTIKIS